MYNVYMRFEVPQFIEIEDKIFGPFTWRQFVYLLGGAGALFMLYILLPFFMFIVLGTPIAVLAGALAFYQVNNRPFVHILESVVLYFVGTRLYLWQKSPAKKVVSATTTSHEAYLPPSQSTIASKARQLEMNALEQKH